MKTFRIVIGILAVSPLALLADQLIFHPTEYDELSIRTLAFVVLGVPILILNYWAWFDHEIIAFYFFGKERN
jgi:hypothetical protein